jgi:hypothetical protein
LSSEQAWAAIESHVQFTLRSSRKTGRRGVKESRLEAEQVNLIAELAAAGSLKPEQAEFLRELLRVTSPLRAPADVRPSAVRAMPLGE